MMYSLPKVSAPGFYVLQFDVAAVAGSIDRVLSIVSPKFSSIFEAEQFMLELPCTPMQVIASDGSNWIQFIDTLQHVMPDRPCLSHWQLFGLSAEELDTWVNVVPIPYLALRGYYDFRLVTECQNGVVCIDCKKRIVIGDSGEQEFEFSFIIG